MLKFYGYLLYRYYSTGQTKGVAYIKTITTIVFLFVMNFISVLILTNQTDRLSLIRSDEKWMQYVKIGVAILPLYLLLFILLKSSELKTLSYEEKQVKRGNQFLILYIVASFLLLFGVLIYRSFID
ncbi:hypothetical protein [Niabella terrae]